MILGKVHIHQLSVDFDLLDAGNVVYHPNYLVLCERARNAALSDAGYPFKEMWSEGYALAVVECHSKYLRALEHEQKIEIQTRTTATTGTTLTVHQEIILASAPPDKKHPMFQVDFTLACVRLNPIKACRMPEKLVTALKLDSLSQ